MMDALQLDQLQARVAPARVYLLRGRTPCDQCGSLFETEIRMACGTTAEGTTLAEPSTTICPSCRPPPRPGGLIQRLRRR